MEPMFDDFDVIYCYTRKQAIEDGVLIDVTFTAQEAGFNWSVAITSAVWHRYIVPDERLLNHGQCEQGRLWDVLVSLLYAASQKSDTVMYFKVSFLMASTHRKTVTLKAVAGFGDSGEPVITIMLPDED